MQQKCKIIQQKTSHSRMSQLVAVRLSYVPETFRASWTTSQFLDISEAYYDILGCDTFCVR